MSTWQQLEIITTAKDAPLLADKLHECGALSVSFKDAGDQPLFQLAPEQTPLWTETRIIALFDEETSIEAVIQQIEHDMPSAIHHLQISCLQDQDWVRQTQANFPPQCFAENLWVIPSWCDKNHYGQNKIIIDPGLAFGTGTHPTTALCLKWLAQHPPQNLTVIDYGCGSGILSLAALALGAKEVYAIDHDPQALQATQNNAQLNHFDQKKLHILSPEDMPSIQAPLIVANMLTQPLIQLAGAYDLLTTKNATLVLSGILVTEINSIAQAYAQYFITQYAKTKEEWALIVLRKRT